MELDTFDFFVQIVSKNGLSRSISKIADKLPNIGFLSAFLVIKAVSIDGRVAKIYDGTMPQERGHSLVHTIIKLSIL